MKLQIGKSNMIDLIEWTNTLLERIILLDLGKVVMLEKSMKAAQEAARKSSMGLLVGSYDY